MQIDLSSGRQLIHDMAQHTTSSKPSLRHGFPAFLSSTVVLVAALSFLGYVLTQAGHLTSPGRKLDATFSSSNGLHPGADVVLAGVTVGAVTSVTLDRQSMMSHVAFAIQNNMHLPVDTQLSIGSSTLTSANALVIMPGTSHQDLADDAVITKTCELVSLEQQISQYIFSANGTGSGCDR